MKTPNFLLIAPILGVLALTGCAEYPIAIKVQGEYGTYSYSAKRGVEIQVNATK